MLRTLKGQACNGIIKKKKKKKPCRKSNAVCKGTVRARSTSSLQREPEGAEPYLLML